MLNSCWPLDVLEGSDMKVVTLALLMCSAPQLPPLHCHHTGQCVCSAQGCRWILNCRDGQRLDAGDGKNRMPVE